MPVDMVVYVTILTLVVFLLFKLPGLTQGANFVRPSGKDQVGKNADAIVLASNGLLTLAIQFLMAPTHTIGDINYASVWHVMLSLLGGGLILAGVVTAVSRPYAIPKPKTRQQKRRMFFICQVLIPKPFDQFLRFMNIDMR